MPDPTPPTAGAAIEAAPDLAALAGWPDDALIGIDLVAALYDCSERHAWRAADRGLIPPPLRVGRNVRWRIGTVREHIRNGCKLCRAAAPDRQRQAL
jgi:predicted DNA-binding transcriptional regulator AlpA